MKTDRKKIFILGIDGATFDIIFSLLERGKLPNVRKIITNGVHGTLHSTIPSLSAPAWVAFMTGKNPGHYGTYHFRKINSKSSDEIYSLDLIDSSAYRGDTFFDYLGEIGYTAGIMTVPVTYPPWEVNGFMVSGYPCPDPDGNPNFTFPHELRKKLPENLNWTKSAHSAAIPKEEMRGVQDPQHLLSGGLSMMSRRTEYTLKLMNEFGCDITILVWGAIDRAQHMLWKHHDPNHILYRKGNKFKTYIEQLYSHADKLVGEIMNRIGPEAQLFIVSDHGFGPRQGDRFHLNAWLNQCGYLKTNLRAKSMHNPLINALKSSVRRFAYRLEISARQKLIKANLKLEISGLDFTKTVAYTIRIDEQTAGLVVNLKGRQRHGLVEEKEYDQIRNEIISRLYKVKDPKSGKNIVKNCYRREELYTGDKAEDAPDIIVVLEDGYCPGSRSVGPILSQIPPSRLSMISGTHRANGILLACGPDISHGKLVEDAHIMDVAPTILYALDEKIPRDIEGKVLRSAFSTERLKNAPEYIDREVSTEFEATELSSAEQESMRRKLADLGYL